MYSDEILYAIALRQCTMIGNATFRKLVQLVGSARQVWQLSKGELAKLSATRQAFIGEIGNPQYLKIAEEEIAFCQKNDIDILYYNNQTLPGLLQHCDDAPVLLFKKGIFHRDKKNLSIVGTRSITHYGRKFLREFMTEITGLNVQTISGLALGTDGMVHEESISNKIPTVAVVAHGLNRIYPAKNHQLAEEILANQGCLLSEYGIKDAFIRTNFIQRNRIIAGISPTTIVVETAFGGGSMSTANFANLYNREVLALPGNIQQKYSQGCNRLIAQNKARIIVDAKSTLEYLGLQGKAKPGNLFVETKDFSLLSAAQKEVMELIVKNPNIALDAIAEKLEKATYKILPILLDLELRGYVEATASRQYHPL